MDWRPKEDKSWRWWRKIAILKSQKPPETKYINSYNSIKHRMNECLRKHHHRAKQRKERERKKRKPEILRNELLKVAKSRTLFCLFWIVFTVCDFSDFLIFKRVLNENIVCYCFINDLSTVRHLILVAYIWMNSGLIHFAIIDSLLLCVWCSHLKKLFHDSRQMRFEARKEIYHIYYCHMRRKGCYAYFSVASL